MGNYAWPCSKIAVHARVKLTHHKLMDNTYSTTSSISCYVLLRQSAKCSTIINIKNISSRIHFIYLAVITSFKKIVKMDTYVQFYHSIFSKIQFHKPCFFKRGCKLALQLLTLKWRLTVRAVYRCLVYYICFSYFTCAFNYVNA